MFNDRYRLTAAVLAGNKTMTRRMIPQGFFSLTWDVRDDTLVYENDFGDFIDIKKSIYAPYKVGEVVAVAQSYKSIFEEDCRRIKEGKPMFNITVKDACDKPGWRNKMFVKAEMMPHRIRITDVRVERLRDISDEDCINEGIWCDTADLEYQCYEFFGYNNNEDDDFDTPREAFASLINKVSGKGTWERNPWVFAYEFELLK